MNSTSLSLLHRLHQDAASDEWRQVIEQYGPAMRGWLRGRGVNDHDADDIVQEVMSVMVRRIGEFKRQRTGSFRRWMRLITVNCMRDHFRRRGRSPVASGGSDMVEMLAELADDASELSRRWDEEHAQHLLQLVLNRIRPEFRSSTWEAFEQVTIRQLPPEQVAKNLNVSTNAIFVAKSRVLKRIREEGAGLIDI